MIDRTQEILPQLQSLFPSIYDVYNENTIIYALLSIYADNIKSRITIIDRLNAMIGIQSTYDEDLERRWGNILGIYKSVSESYDNYRSRLMLTYISLMGGTVKAIQYAIASVLSVVDYNNISKYIHVYDAWKYNGSLDISKLVNDGIITQEYGDIICLIDIACNENSIVNANDIKNAINIVKASGVMPQLLFLYTAIDNAVLNNTDSYKVSSKISETHAEYGALSAYNITDIEASRMSSIFDYGVFGESIFDSSDCDNSDTFIDKITYIQGGK